MASDTIHTMNKKVERGLKKAREYAKGDEQLLAFLDLLEATYESRVKDAIMLGTHIWAFHWRGKEYALKWMEETRQRADDTVMPNTNQRSEMIN